MEEEQVSAEMRREQLRQKQLEKQRAKEEHAEKVSKLHEKWMRH